MQDTQTEMSSGSIISGIDQCCSVRSAKQDRCHLQAVCNDFYSFMKEPRTADTLLKRRRQKGFWTLLEYPASPGHPICMKFYPKGGARVYRVGKTKRENLIYAALGKPPPMLGETCQCGCCGVLAQAPVINPLLCSLNNPNGFPKWSSVELNISLSSGPYEGKLGIVYISTSPRKEF